MLGGSDPRNIHRDLLEAQCPDEESKAKLITAIRERATGAFKVGDMPSARVLYGKSIQLKQDATIYSNLALVCLRLSELDEALKNADNALKMDGTMLKAHHRKILALHRLERFEEAMTAYKAVENPNEELNKLRDDINRDAEKKKIQQEKLRAEAQDMTKARPVPQPTRVPLAPVQSEKTDVKPTPENKGENTQEPSSFKGYKINAQGQKTSYFHTDLSEEAKAMLPDMRPQAIQVDENSPKKERKNDNPFLPRSSWNENTFETKDCTKYAKDEVKQFFPLNFDLMGGQVSVEITLEKTTGELTVSASRGKIKVLDMLNYEFNWQVIADNAEATGNYKFENATDGDYDVVSTTKNCDPKLRSFVSSDVSKEGKSVQMRIIEELHKITKHFIARAES